jgi:two-component system, LytTR family, response regulator
MEKLVIKSSNYLHFVHISEILYCKGDKSKTVFYLTNDKPVETKLALKNYEDLLNPRLFIKPHSGYLVNVKHVEEIRTAWPRYLSLTNGKKVPLAFHRRKKVIELFQYL